VIIEMGFSPDQSRQINHLAAGRSFGEGQAIEIVEFRNVAPDRGDVVTDLLDRRRQLGVTPPSDEHARALADELLRRRQANPAIATGHESDLALELPHVSISLVVLVSHHVESRTTARRPYRRYLPGKSHHHGSPDPSDARSWASDSETAKI
jgi:hypothetical protein